MALPQIHCPLCIHYAWDYKLQSPVYFEEWHHPACPCIREVESMIMSEGDRNELLSRIGEIAQARSDFSPAQLARIALLDLALARAKAKQ